MMLEEARTMRAGAFPAQESHAGLAGWAFRIREVRDSLCDPARHRECSPGSPRARPPPSSRARRRVAVVAHSKLLQCHTKAAPLTGQQVVALVRALLQRKVELLDTLALQLLEEFVALQASKHTGREDG